jgi:DNA-directed RNA polymerase subunit H
MTKKIFDTRKHNLVYKHVKLGEKEKESILTQYDVSIAEMPKIRKRDPALAGLSAKPGDIIKIVRPSPTAGEAVYYRVVVRG